MHYDITDSTGREVFQRFRSQKQALIHLQNTRLKNDLGIEDKRRIIKCHYDVRTCKYLSRKQER